MSIYMTHPAEGHEFANLVYLPFIKKVVIDEADLSAANTYDVPIRAGTFVLSVGALITEAFVVGGGATATVGDGAQADGYLDAADFDAVTLGHFAHSLGGDETLAAGKYYSAAGVVRLTLNGNPSAGACELHILMYELAAPARASLSA